MKNKPYSAGEASKLQARAEHENTGQKLCVCAFDTHDRLLPRIQNYLSTQMEDAHAKNNTSLIKLSN